MWVDTGGWNGAIKVSEYGEEFTITKKDPPKRYVVGFMFSPSCRSVLLIKKNRPDWQKGKLNGVGGKIEPTDLSPATAMQREFYEETGIAYGRWEHFATLSGAYAVVYVFRCWSSLHEHAQTKTDEEVGRYFTDSLPANILPNLKFLIPFALTPGYEHTTFHFTEPN